MADSQVQQFTRALESIESAQSHDEMVALFAEDCRVGNVLAPEHFEGREGAARFWKDYRGSFGEIRSEFHNIIESSNEAALEWTAQGTSVSGDSIRYQGITVLEFRDGKIARFMSYFDPRGLGRQFSVSSDEALQGA